MRGRSKRSPLAVWGCLQPEALSDSPRRGEGRGEGRDQERSVWTRSGGDTVESVETGERAEGQKGEASLAWTYGAWGIRQAAGKRIALE